MRAESSAVSRLFAPARPMLLLPLGSPGAGDHPADDDTDDLNSVAARFEQHALVLVAGALRVELDGPLGPVAHAPKDHLVVDVCRDDVAVGNVDVSLCVAIARQRDDCSVCESGAFHRVAAHAQTQIRFRPEHVPQHLVVDPCGLCRSFPAQAYFGFRVLELLRLVQRGTLAQQDDPSFDTWVQENPTFVGQSLQVLVYRRILADLESFFELGAGRTDTVFFGNYLDTLSR